MSAFNVDIKAGPLHHLLAGAEVDRVYPSAALREAKNFGVLTPFWDLVFGTFFYDPKRLPATLGVAAPEHYPQSDALGQVLALPFSRSATTPWAQDDAQSEP